jgi:hypothetical protein
MENIDIFNIFKNKVVVTLSGDIEAFGIMRIITLLINEKKTGMLNFMFGNGVAKGLIFENDEFISTCSNLEEEKFGEWLCSRGKITKAELNIDLEKQKTAEKDELRPKLGAILFGDGVLSTKDLYNESKERIRQIVISLINYKNKGKFFFLEGNMDLKKIVKISDLKILEILTKSKP